MKKVSNEQRLPIFRLGFLWKYGGLYLDQDILTVRSLLEDSGEEGNSDRNLKAADKKVFKHTSLRDNFIAFQSLNISHLLPDDPTPRDAQDLYTEESEQTAQQGNTNISKSSCCVIEILDKIFLSNMLYVFKHCCCRH